MLSAARASWLRGAEPGLHRQPGVGHLPLELRRPGPRTSVGRQRIGDAPDRRAARAARPTATLAQLDGFVADYEAVRGAPFSDHEHEVLAAGQGWIASYGARRQHSDDLLGIFPTSISRGAGPASSAISWIGPPRQPHRRPPPPATRRSGAATDRLICARPRLASRATTEHCGIHPGHGQAPSRGGRGSWVVWSRRWVCVVSDGPVHDSELA
jgi:hypothetical protein